MFSKIKHAFTALGGIALIALTLTGCSAEKEVLYFQNLTPEATISQAVAEPIKIQPGDEIMVYVSTSDPETAARLSLMAGAGRPQMIEGVGVQVQNNTTVLPYTVNKQGNISIPIIGSVHVAGLTRQQISEAVEERILNAHLVKDNTVNVTVQFANLSFSAIGEVAHPGKYSISKDDMSVLEALSAAGDLSIYGRRDKVWVLREQPDGTRKAYQIDMRGTDFLSSPAYYVQQNDIIYVEPNSVRSGQSTLNENTFKSVGFWTSLASLAITIATFAITLSR